MGSKQWWTVFAVYDEDQQPFITFVEARDKPEAWTAACGKADGIIRPVAIAPDKIRDAGIEGLDDVVPIRGKEHAISVSRVRITKHVLVVPGRCPRCKCELRRTGAIVETMLDTRQWLGHLSANGKDVCGERDQGKHARGTTFEFVNLDCAKCGHAIWEGLHVDK